MERGRVLQGKQPSEGFAPAISCAKNHNIELAICLDHLHSHVCAHRAYSVTHHVCILLLCANTTHSHTLCKQESLFRACVLGIPVGHAPASVCNTSILTVVDDSAFRASPACDTSGSPRPQLELSPDESAPTDFSGSKLAK